MKAHFTSSVCLQRATAGDLKQSNERSETLSDRVSVLLVPRVPWFLTDTAGSDAGR